MSHYTWETTKGVNKYEMDVNCTRIRCVLMLTWSNLQTHFFLRLHFVTPSPPALARLLRPVLSLYIEQELLQHSFTVSYICHPRHLLAPDPPAASSSLDSEESTLAKPRDSGGRWEAEGLLGGAGSWVQSSWVCLATLESGTGVSPPNWRTRRLNISSSCTRFTCWLVEFFLSGSYLAVVLEIVIYHSVSRRC
jgi:hypothetical protein